MKAMVWTKYGPPDGLQLQEVAKPTPRDDEVLIRIHATTVTAGDCELRRFKLPIQYRLPLRLFLGLQKPQRITILGQELAGEIEATGKDVTRFREGDEVFAWAALRLGCYAEYACMRENAMMAIRPANMTYEEAATLAIGGLEAVQFLRKVNIRSGQKVVIVGAGGSIGTYAVQLAKSLGAEVTAVDSAGKLDMLRSIGADKVIDYAREDFTKAGETYDIIYDVVGKSPFSRSIRSLKEDGCYILGNPGLLQSFRGQWITRNSTKRIILRTSSQSKDDLDFLKEMVEAGKIKSIIDRRYPLEQIADAHRYVETGQKKGNVVITV